jgi:hypothetical protein
VVKKPKEWLTLREAAQATKRYLRTSLGAAREIVCDAGASGQVRTRHNTAGWGPTALTDVTWAGAKIDLENEILTGSDGVKPYSGVEMNSADLRDWLARNRDWLMAEYRPDIRKAPPRVLQTNKPPIPHRKLKEHLQAIKERGGPIPAADSLVSAVAQAFTNYYVTRQDVRTTHAEVWGPQPPGRRKRNHAE